jgi:hypothetical protein
MNTLIRWGKFNLVGAMGMVVQLAALALFNRALADARADQYRVRLDAGDREHGGKQCVLVFAIAILIAENLSCSMRLVSADAKVDANVANLGGNVGVEGADLFFIGGFARDELGDLSFDFRAGRGAVGFEAAIPGTHLLPALEGRPLNRRKLTLIGVELLIGGPDDFFLGFSSCVGFFGCGWLELR